MPNKLPRLSSVALQLFERCPSIDDPNVSDDIRLDDNGRQIRLHDFGNEESEFGWVIQNVHGNYVAWHIESFSLEAGAYLEACIEAEAADIANREFAAEHSGCSNREEVFAG